MIHLTLSGEIFGYLASNIFFHWNYLTLSIFFVLIIQLHYHILQHVLRPLSQSPTSPLTWHCMVLSPFSSINAIIAIPFFLIWSTVDIQNYVNFRCTTWFDVCMYYDRHDKCSNHLSPYEVTVMYYAVCFHSCGLFYNWRFICLNSLYPFLLLSSPSLLATTHLFSVWAFSFHLIRFHIGARSYDICLSLVYLPSR